MYLVSLIAIVLVTYGSAGYEVSVKFVYISFKVIKEILANVKVALKGHFALSHYLGRQLFAKV